MEPLRHIYNNPLVNPASLTGKLIAMKQTGLGKLTSDECDYLIHVLRSQIVTNVCDIALEKLKRNAQRTNRPTD